MQAIRQIIQIQKLKTLCNIPDHFSADKVVIIIPPVFPENNLKQSFDPEQFFGISHLNSRNKNHANTHFTLS